jgi:hypothetical protein
VLKTSNFTQIYEKTRAASHNTEFWIDPKRHIGVVMMQVLPFYDKGAIRTLRGFEGLVYPNVR